MNQVATLARVGIICNDRMQCCLLCTPKGTMNFVLFVVTIICSKIHYKQYVTILKLFFTFNKLKCLPMEMEEVYRHMIDRINEPCDSNSAIVPLYLTCPKFSLASLAYCPNYSQFPPYLSFSTGARSQLDSSLNLDFVLLLIHVIS